MGQGDTDSGSRMVHGHRELVWSSPPAGLSVIAQSANKVQRQFGPCMLCRLLVSPPMTSSKRHLSGQVMQAMDGWQWMEVLSWNETAGGTWESRLGLQMVMELPAPEQCHP